jgi:hypothetical protein
MHPEYQGGWVVFDILPDLIESFIGTDDVLPIVALPDGLSKAFGDCGLEGSDHSGDGSGMPDPYIFKDQDSVEMVRHDNEGIQRHPREMLWNIVPARGNNLGNGIEDWSSFTGADSDEVCARSGVVIAWEAYGSAAGFHIFWYTETAIPLTKPVGARHASSSTVTSIPKSLSLWPSTPRPLC